MSETILVAVVSLVGTLGGSLFGVLASARLTNFRLEQLEKKVENFGEFIETTYMLEKRVSMLEEKCLKN